MASRWRATVAAGSPRGAVPDRRASRARRLLGRPRARLRRHLPGAGAADRPRRPAGLGARRPGAVRRRRRVRRRVVRLLADWLPLAALLLAYDASRGLADGLGATVHVTEPAAVDRWLGRRRAARPSSCRSTGTPPGGRRSPRLVYGSHFVVTPLVLGRPVAAQPAALGRATPGWSSALSAAGLLTYVLYPAAPPWLAARDGVIEPVAAAQRRRAGRCSACRAPARCWPTARGRSTRWRPCPRCTPPSRCSPAWCSYPVARRAWQRLPWSRTRSLMALVLVWSGEHYVVDTVLGAAYAGVVVLAAARTPGRCSPGAAARRRRTYRGRRDRRRPRPAARLADAAPGGSSSSPAPASPPTAASPTTAGPNGVWTRDPDAEKLVTLSLLPGRPRHPPPRLADAPATPAGADPQPERRARGAGRPGAAGAAARAAHPEHRRAAPARPAPRRTLGPRAARHRARGRVPVAAATGRRWTSALARIDGGRAGPGLPGLRRHPEVGDGQLRPAARRAACSRPRAAAAADCDVFLAVGTSLQVSARPPGWPTSPPAPAPGSSSSTPSRRPYDDVADLVVREPIGTALPRLVGADPRGPARPLPRAGAATSCRGGREARTGW